MPKAKGKKYGPVNKYIYCRVDTCNLTDEHILAANLGGEIILNRACCAACQDIINQQIEQPSLQTLFKHIRYQYKIGSRRLNKRPKTVNTYIPDDDELTETPQTIDTSKMPTKEVEYCDYPIFAVWPIFKTPEILRGLPYGDSDDNHRIGVLKAYGPPPSGKFEPPYYVEVNVNLFLLTRLLAKIAHGYSVLKFGMDGFSPLLNDLILRGDPDSAPYLVGGAKKPGEILTKLHCIEVKKIRTSSHVFTAVDIQLFAHMAAPTYRVVSGKHIQDGCGFSPYGVPNSDEK